MPCQHRLHMISVSDQLMLNLILAAVEPLCPLQLAEWHIAYGHVQVAGFLQGHGVHDLQVESKLAATTLQNYTLC